MNEEIKMALDGALFKRAGGKWFVHFRQGIWIPIPKHYFKRLNEAAQEERGKYVDVYC